jgi:hypothetical protein
LDFKLMKMKLKDNGMLIQARTSTVKLLRS